MNKNSRTYILAIAGARLANGGHRGGHPHVTDANAGSLHADRAQGGGPGPLEGQRGHNAAPAAVLRHQLLGVRALHGALAEEVPAGQGRPAQPPGRRHPAARCWRRSRHVRVLCGECLPVT